MSVGNVSFGRGFIKIDDSYINPDNIVRTKKGLYGTIVDFSNDIENGRCGTKISNKVYDISVENFMKGVIEAQKTGNIINLDA